MELAVKAFDENDLDLAYRVEPLEQVVDGIIEGIKLNHINRLQAGKCTIQQGFVLSDILTNYERVSDHCSNTVSYTHLDRYEKNSPKYSVLHTYPLQFYNRYPERFQLIRRKYPAFVSEI